MADSVIIYRESLKPFTAACGKRQPLALRVSRSDLPSATDVRAFDKPFVRIGRSIHNDLALPERAVSFRHLYLQMVQGHWLYFDLHATTRSQGRRERPTWGWLDQTPELQAGPYRVCAEAQGVSEQERRLRGRVQTMPEAVTEFELELVNQRKHPTRRIRRAVSLIGSSQNCDLWLKDPSVSSVHASLVLTPHGVWVVDLLGRNGVTVNRKRVSWKQLENGSYLEIGRYCFRIWINNGKPLTIDKSARSVARAASSEPAWNAGMPDGGLTREFVMGVLNHLVDSRAEFFEHLQQQSQLIQQLFTQLNEARPTPVLGAWQQIERLDHELTEIKQQLQRLSEVYESTDRLPSPAQPDCDQELLQAELQAPAIDTVDAFGTCANGPVDPDAPPITVDCPATSEEREPKLRGGETLQDGDALPRSTAPDMSVQAAHTLLSLRMSRLSQERNTLLRSLLRHLRLS